MDLRSPSFWRRRDAPAPTYPPLDRPLSCDVLIIGAGLTGAVIASDLSRRGERCILLDRRDIAAGSTAASTALVLYDLDEPLHRLQKRLGECPARRLYLLHHEGIGALKALAAGAGEPVPWLDAPALYLARRDTDLPMLDREAAARRAAGLPVLLLPAADLAARFGIDRPGAILSPGAGLTDPFIFTHALVRSAADRGARVYARTRITALEPHRSHIIARTSRAAHVTARRIVFAGGYESLPYAPSGLARLRATYALATEPLAAPPAPFAAWEAGRPYSYLRTTTDNRLIIGGADEDFTSARARDRLVPRKARVLARALARLAPSLTAPGAFAWAGAFAETQDGAGYLAPSPRLSHALLALACGGNGMSFAPIAAALTRSWLDGKPHPDAPLFRFDRSIDPPS